MENDGKTTPMLIVPTNAPSVAVTTRRSNISRGRRPQAVTRSQQTVTEDNSIPEITTRRPISRGRRPINYANNRTTTARTTTARNTNRVRYNPNNEERNRQRTRTRTSPRPTKENEAKDEENIDYQRGMR